MFLYIFIPKQNPKLYSFTLYAKLSHCITHTYIPLTLFTTFFAKTEPIPVRCVPLLQGGSSNYL